MQKQFAKSIDFLSKDSMAQEWNEERINNFIQQRNGNIYMWYENGKNNSGKYF